MISSSILVIDDDPSVAEQIRQSCRHQQPHINVIGVESGDDAAAMLTRMSPDLIVLDMVLRHESAYEILPDLRLAAPLCPIVMLSLHDNVAARYLCKQLGAAAYEQKPSHEEGYAGLVGRLQQRMNAGRTTFGRVVEAKRQARAVELTD